MACSSRLLLLFARDSAVLMTVAGKPSGLSLSNLILPQKQSAATTTQRQNPGEGVSAAQLV
jgi:hypothetical protein